MSAEKGPIERIREAVSYMASRMSTPQIESFADDVREACDELEKAGQADEVTAMTAIVTDAEKRAVFKALNSGGHDGWSSQRAMGQMLAKICADWLDQKQAEVAAAQRDQDSYFDLDSNDLADIDRAITMRKALNALPASDSCERGALLAEICRGWMDRVEHDRKQKDPIDNGDGTVTFLSVPVTVPKSLVADGSIVLAVRSPKKGDRYWDTWAVGGIADSDWFREYRIIASAPPAPKFREGGYYRDTAGEIRGPLRRVDWTADKWGWFDQDDRQYTPEGKAKSRVADLRPGEVTVWANPPASLAANEYIWSKDGVLRCGGFIVVHGTSVRYLSDWTDPPKPGRYRVPGGGKLATWEGDA